LWKWCILTTIMCYVYGNFYGTCKLHSKGQRPLNYNSRVRSKCYHYVILCNYIMYSDPYLLRYLNAFITLFMTTITWTQHFFNLKNNTIDHSFGGLFSRHFWQMYRCHGYAHPDPTVTQDYFNFNTDVVERSGFN